MTPPDFSGPVLSLLVWVAFSYLSTAAGLDEAWRWGTRSVPKFHSESSLRAAIHTHVSVNFGEYFPGYLVDRMLLLLFIQYTLSYTYHSIHSGELSLLLFFLKNITITGNVECYDLEGRRFT